MGSIIVRPIKLMEGINYPKNKKMSDDNIIEYDGHCAFAMSTGKVDVKGGKSQLVIGEKTYSFYNPIAKFLFRILPNRIDIANKVWSNK